MTSPASLRQPSITDGATCQHPSQHYLQALVEAAEPCDLAFLWVVCVPCHLQSTDTIAASKCDQTHC